MTNPKEWIGELHELEKETLEILEILAKSMKLMDASVLNSKKEEFEQHCLRLADLLSSIQSNFTKITDEIQKEGISLDRSMFPYRVSIAADEKRFHLMQDTVRLLLKIL
jgi:hypothetical protein